MSALQELKRIEKILKSGATLPRVVFLAGEEGYYIDRIEEQIVESYIPPEDRKTERVIFYGSESKMSDVALQAQSASLFSDRRLVVLREAQQVGDLDKLLPLIPKIPSASTLLLVYRGNLRKEKSKLMTALEAFPPETLLAVESPAIKNSRDILSVVTQSVARHGAKIDETARHRLVELIGYNGSSIDKEIEKLAIAAGSAPITINHVALLVPHTRRYSIYDLTQEIEKRNTREILRLGEIFAADEKNYPLPMLVATLYEFFCSLMAVHYLPSAQRTPAVIATSLGLKNSYQADRYIRAVNLYGPKKTFDIVHALRMTDARYKGAELGDSSPGQLYMNLLFAICL